MVKPVTVIKASGEEVVFSSDKLYRSLQRSGANDAIIHQIIEKVEEKLHDGISTKEIYRHAFRLLKQKERAIAAKYGLKKAIMQLGPSGYPFEKYIGEILKFQGYATKVGEIVEGHCVDHEVDVIAQKEHHHFMVECKFHNHSGHKCDVKVPLYIQSRFKDIEKKWVKLPGHENKFHQGWVVTNTKFTEDAIKYGKCVGLKLMSWDYPEQGSLKQRVDLSGLHPITCLTSLSEKEKQQLLKKSVVLCREMVQNPELMTRIGIKESKVKNILKEVKALCENTQQTT